MYEALGVGVIIGGRAILSDIDLGLAPGKVTVLIGPNGAGKSTLLKVMAGERRPTAGSVRLHGRPIARTRPAELAALRAVLPQSVALAFPFRVREVVRMGLPQAIARRRADEIVERALAAVWLAAFADKEATTLSGGEQQRAHLARVLAQLWAAPDLGLARYLLLDEPTASLDLAHQLLVLEVARAHAAAGGGVLAVMHDLNLAAMMGDRIVAIAGGRIVADGPPAAVIDDRLLAGTYGTDLRVGVAPDTVFVLPQSGDPRSGLPRTA
jgi:iron complex transport system ATP-binding protein